MAHPGVFAAALAAALAGGPAEAPSSAPSHPRVQGEGGEPACRGSVSGAVTGTFACVADVSTGDEGKVFFVITPKDSIAGVPTYQPGSFELLRPVAARTYTLAELGFGMASVAAEGGTLYTATKTSSQRGEVELALASVQADPRRKGAVVVHGTYRARLVPAGAGKTGEVVVEVRF